MTTASQAPGYPFMAGQEITVSDLTAEMRQWVADGRAEIVSDVPELATLAPHEQAVLKRGRRK